MKRAFLIAALIAAGAAFGDAPTMLENLVSIPRQISQRLSNWVSTPNSGCEKANVQAAVSDVTGMMAANHYFGEMASYMADEHQCALDAMDDEKREYQTRDKNKIEKLLVAIGQINDRLKAEKPEGEARMKLEAKRDHLSSLLPFGLDAGAMEYLGTISARPNRTLPPQMVKSSLRTGLEKYINESHKKLKSDFDRWHLASERAQAALAGRDSDFTGRHFDNQLRQVAQDPVLFASLNKIVGKRLGSSKTHEGTLDYDVGRCLVSARFGEGRRTVSMVIDGALLLSSVIPFAGWGIALTRAYRVTRSVETGEAAEAVAALVERGARFSPAKVKQGVQEVVSQKKSLSPIFNRVGTAAVGTGAVKLASDCYASCYENVLTGVASSVEGQIDCQRITKVKKDLRNCAVTCARTFMQLNIVTRAAGGVVADDVIEGAIR